MTTYVPSSVNLPYQFQVTLDGELCSVTVAWLTGGQKPYMTLLDNTNTPVMTKPVIGSPDGYDINLVWPYFTTSTMVYRVSTEQFEINP